MLSIRKGCDEEGRKAVYLSPLLGGKRPHRVVDLSLPLGADEITVSAPNERVDLEALKRPRLGGKEPTRLSRQPSA